MCARGRTGTVPATPDPAGDGRTRRRRTGPARPAGETGETAAGPSRAQREQEALDLLTSGELELEGRLVDASNVTMFGKVASDAGEAACVYKPVAGERPLWDFPEGTLAGREVAAYRVSRAAGWNVVPPTVYRDGPFGPGMCQLWIDIDDSVDLVGLSRSSDQALRQMAVFDAVVNNADRKIGHLLPARDGHLYGCDHGVCFGSEYKLRTVLWQWRGKPLPGKAVVALQRLSETLNAGGTLAAELSQWLDAEEMDATLARVELLIQHKVHPFPPADWPAVPWPPV
jgi:uncharacterized repeat protein (TIGR03843 family)